MSKMPNRIGYFFSDFLRNRPLCFLSTIGGLRDFLLGLGFIFSVNQITNTVLYQNFSAIAPGVYAGALFILMGGFTMLTAFVDKIRYARWGLRVQAFVWLFSAIMYALGGNWIFAFMLGGYFSVMAGYLAYYYKYAPLWARQKRDFRDQWIKQHDPFAHVTDSARI
jgi:hypothetical protein